MNPDSEFSWTLVEPSPEQQFNQILADIIALKPKVERLPSTPQGQAAKLMIEAVCIVLADDRARASTTNSDRS